MSVLFALLPDGVDAAKVVGDDSVVQAAAKEVSLRRYPCATDARHMSSLVRDGRDPMATQWLNGMVMAVVWGAVLGAIINGVLAYGFDMFGGLTSVAVSLGFALGAFLGGFTAAMTGTHAALPELRALLRQAKPGDSLLQWSGADRSVLQSLRSCCQRHGLTCLLID